MRKLKKRVRDAQFMASLARYSIQSCRDDAEDECEENCIAASGTVYYTRAVFLDDRTHRYRSA